MAEQRRHIKSRYNYIIHPFSTLSASLEVIFFSLWLARMCIEPIYSNMAEKHIVYQAIDNYALSMVHVALIVCFFFVGFIDFTAKEVVIQPRRVGSKYLKTFFLFDLLACKLLHGLSLRLLKRFIKANDFRWKILKIVSYIHVPCLFIRLNTVLNYLDHIGQMMKLNGKIRKVINYCVKTYLYMHFFSCMLYFVPQVVYHDNWPTDSWLIKAKIYPPGNSRVSRIYGECLIMTICYFFGTSPGMYEIFHSNEQVCLTIIAFFGRLYTLFLLADALRMFGIVGLSESNYERKLAEVREYMNSNNLPRGLRSRMIRYYEYKLQKRYFNETEILNSLSDNLRNEIYLFSARSLLQKSNVFKYLPRNDVVTLISMMRLETFAPEDIIFKPDMEMEDAYFISSGTVAMVNKDGLELCHLEDGDVFGLCTTLQGKRNLGAVVLETSDIFLINLNEFYQFISAFPEAEAYLRLLTKERLATYKNMERIALNKTDTCLVELRMGRLLETKRKRTRVMQ